MESRRAAWKQKKRSRTDRTCRLPYSLAWGVRGMPGCENPKHCHRNWFRSLSQLSCGNEPARHHRPAAQRVQPAGLRRDLQSPGRARADGGRIYRDTKGTVGGASPWFWTVEHHQRAGRAAPQQGRCDSLDEAKAAWRRCWDSADTPIHWPPSKRLGKMLRDDGRTR